MLTRLSTPSSFPQTPARQTAPAAQRPAAQRQGFSKVKFSDGYQTLEGLENLQPNHLMPEAQKARLSETLLAGWNDFSTIAREFSRLATDEAYNQNKSEVEATLSVEYPGLLGALKAFDKECPAEDRGRYGFIQSRIEQAERLSKAFKELYYKHFPPTLCRRGNKVFSRLLNLLTKKIRSTP